MESGRGLIGRIVTGAGGVALVVSVFISWYSLSFADILRGVASQLPPRLSGSLTGALAAGDPTLTWSGWNAVHVVRFVVLGVGLAVVYSSVSSPRVAGNRGALLVPVGGLLAAVLVAFRIESPPGALDISVGPFQFPSPAGTGLALSSLLRIELGAWIALGGGVVVLLGGLLVLANGRAAPAPPQPVDPSSESTADRDAGDTMPAARLDPDGPQPRGTVTIP